MNNVSELNEAFSIKTLPNTIGIVFLLIVGIFGNLLVLYVYEFRFSPSGGRCYIGPLAFFDLGIVISTSVLNLLQNLMKFIFPGQVVCKCVIFLCYTFINTSLFLWTVIAVQRYRKICKPFEWQMNEDGRKRWILICAGFPLAFFSPILYFYGINEKVISERNITVYVCEQTTTDVKGLIIYQGLGLLLSFVNVIAIVSIYIIVFIKIFKTLRGIRMARTGNQQSVTLGTLPVTSTTTVEDPISGSSYHQHTDAKPSSCPESQRVEHKIAFTFVTIVLIGLISYVPSRSIVVYESINPKFWQNLSDSTFLAYLFLRRSYAVAHSCNVFVYLIFDPMFREVVKQWINDKCGRH